MYFDNSPAQVMVVDVGYAIRKLSFAGCEVLRVKLDSYRAVVEISPHNAPEPQFREQGYAGVDQYRLRVVWRCEDAGEGVKA